MRVRGGDAMAIYSCNLKSIGRTTHAPGTAGAHIHYVSRPDAQPVILAGHMPRRQDKARLWMDRRERGMRSNARVLDKLRIALPRELTEKQRAALVERFVADLTGGRVPWYAAIHQRGTDGHNPHVHIAIHDRDIETGRRVLRLSDSARDRRKAGLPGPKAVEWIRERWETVCNKALAKAGVEVRIDRRTLVAQGIDRKAGIHEGPRAQHIEGTVRRPRSRECINGCGRLIDYPSIDQGRTRREFNAQIIDLNLERAASSKNPVTVVWAQHEKDELARDRALEERLAEEEKKRTAKLRATGRSHGQRIVKLRKERDRQVQAAVNKVRGKFERERERLRKTQTGQRAELSQKQSRLRARLLRILDITGITRRQQEAARKVLARRHGQARRELSERYRTARSFAEKNVKARYAAMIEAAQRKRLSELAQMKQRHEKMAQFAEEARQQREIEREHSRQLAEKKIETWRKTRKGRGPLGKDSGLAKALERAARQEARRGTGKGKDRDKDMDRGR